MKKTASLFFAAAAVFLSAGFAAAHSGFSSADYAGVDDVVDAGGSTASSADYSVLSAIGQAAIGQAASADYVINAGFLRAKLVAPTATPTVVLTATPTATPTAAPETDLKNAYIYPSLVNFQQGRTVLKFMKLAKDVYIRIYNINGGVVMSLEAAAETGNCEIDLSKTNISPGIYICVISRGSAEHRVFRFAVVR
ncbi:MAG TPA: T9SS type A sorting domain-containing protein [bacterium]|nr:T9SS type A sorting domain-containing protein [bacterium]